MTQKQLATTAALSALRFYGSISKLDEEQRMVFGYVSSEAVDSQGETVTKDAIKNAWTDYMKYGNVREMHKPSAVGVVKEYSHEDVGTFVGVKVVDDVAWKKVQEGVYKGFSIGGNKVPNGYDPVTKTISALTLAEISLVDRPSNPEANITLWKSADDEGLAELGATTANADASTELVALIAKGALSAAEVLELAKAAVEKKAESTKSEAAPRFAALKKFFGDLVSFVKIDKADTGAVRKGMYSVAEFADLIMCLKWLADDARYEAEYEADGSTVPGKLYAAVKTLSDVFLEMAAEELKELLPANAGLTDVIQLCDPTGELAKRRAVLLSDADHQDAAAICKAFGLELPAPAAATEPEGGLAKALTEADALGRIAKAEAVTAKALGTFEKLAGDIGALRTEVAGVKKTLEAMPQAPKGQGIAVSKDGDAGADGNTPEVAPVMKTDGTVDTVATLVKAAHAGGGTPVFGHAARAAG